MDASKDTNSELTPPIVLSTQATQAARQQYSRLVSDLALTGTIAHSMLAKLARLYAARTDEIAPWLALWREHCEQYFDLKAAEEILSGDVEAAEGMRLFLAHTYCKIVLEECFCLAVANTHTEGRPSSLYGWIDCIHDDELRKLRDDLRRHIADHADLAVLEAVPCSDLLATVYQELLPPALRHLLGEYYTPSWLVEYCIGKVEDHSVDLGSEITVLDPTAGSGSFLAHYITHLAASRRQTTFRIVGFDINPLAVDFCRANTAIAVSKARRSCPTASFDVRVRLADAVVDPTTDNDGPLFGTATNGAYQKKVLGTYFSSTDTSQLKYGEVVRNLKLAAPVREAFLSTLEQYVSDAFAATRSAQANVVVGNPPWITWDGLVTQYREKVAPQWVTSTLVTNTGWRAKVAAGKTDFSSLFVYRAAQRHATVGAIMVFVLPLSLFQSRLAGAGFRTFRTEDRRRFPVVEIDDFADVKVFPDAANRTSVGTFSVDRELAYPIPYIKWRSVSGTRSVGELSSTPLLGGPIDTAEANSPVVAFEPGHTQLQTVVGKSDYRARGGVNTGGANTILWLEVLAETDSSYRIRNVGKSRRGSSAVLEAEVEKDAVYPLLCGPDMRRWKAKPSKSILLLYGSEQPKKALPINVVQARFPRAYEFALKFQTELAGRKEYHRWGCSGPFYEVYRIGPYTFSPIKIVWQHTGYRKSLNVSVVDDRGRRLTIPDQKAIIIPFDNLEEAHYACAFLASGVTANLLNRYLGTDASTHILDYVALRRFVPEDTNHKRLAELSLLAHEAASTGTSLDDVEGEIDSIVARLLRVA